MNMNWWFLIFLSIPILSLLMIVWLSRWTYGSCRVCNRFYEKLDKPCSYTGDIPSFTYYPIARRSMFGTYQVYLTPANCGFDNPYQWYSIQSGFDIEFNAIWSLTCYSLLDRLTTWHLLSIQLMYSFSFCLLVESCFCIDGMNDWCFGAFWFRLRSFPLYCELFWLLLLSSFWWPFNSL